MNCSDCAFARWIPESDLGMCAWEIPEIALPISRFYFIPAEDIVTDNTKVKTIQPLETTIRKSSLKECKAWKEINI